MVNPQKAVIKKRLFLPREIIFHLISGPSLYANGLNDKTIVHLNTINDCGLHKIIME